MPEEVDMWALVLALGGLLSVATAQGPEFDLQKFKETYVRDGAIASSALCRCN